MFLTHLASGAGQLVGAPRYAVSADGRFLMNITVEDMAAALVSVVVNWQRGLPSGEMISSIASTQDSPGVNPAANATSPIAVPAHAARIGT